MTTYAAITNLNMTDVYSIGSRGIVLGTFIEGNGSGTSILAPAVWQNGAITSPVSYSTAANNDLSFTGMNSSGVFVGYASFTEIPAVWQNGTLTYLPVWSNDTTGYATGINGSGEIVGATFGPDVNHALFWQNGVVQLLAPLAGDSKAGAFAITDSAVVFGNSYGSSLLPDGTPLAHAVSWQNGAVTALPTVAGEASSWIDAANNAGAVVGAVYLSDKISHAALWQNGTLTVLATPTGYQTAEATGLDNSGRVVGYAETASGNMHAILWNNGIETDLNSLVDGSSGWVFQRATSINDSGQIVGNGTYNGDPATFLLTLGGGLGLVPPSAALNAIEVFQSGHLAAPLVLSDYSTDVVANLDGLQGLAAAGKLASIALSDQGTPNLTITQYQAAGDVDALKAISNDYTVMIPLSTASYNANVVGVAGHGSVLDMVDSKAGGYTVTATGDGVGFTLAAAHVTLHVDDVTAVKFSDYTAIIASQTPAAAGGVSSFQVAAIYSAVLARTPDIAGLSFYERYAATNPSTPLLTYAEWFLKSGEYTSNSAHAYAETSAGEAQFITDTYNNLLHRTPTVDELTFYQTKVIDPILANVVPGTAAYTAADLQAHAQLLTYFGSSSEFRTDVQVTALQPANAQHWLVLI